MTKFEHSVVSAYRARIDHGEKSQQYVDALDEMERARIARVDRGKWKCSQCGVSGHTASACPKMADHREAP